SGTMSSDSENINVFCRVKPSPEDDTVEYKARNDYSENIAELEIANPLQSMNRHSQNAQTTHKFAFTKIFDQTSTQSDIYEAAGRPLVESSFQGINGTLFVYGQTATGKTYTVSGYDNDGATSPIGESPRELSVTEDSGVITRVLSDIFSGSTGDNELESVTISYLEIYKEVGYDLLGEGRSKSHPDELPRVTPMKDARKRLNLRNLSVHTVNSEQEALRWFELGNTNRKVAETHLNDASSRSHCVFTIGVTCKKGGNNKTTLTAKVNIVDLAGSERVGKSHIERSTLLSEARNINLSLHHLQQVIVALSKGALRHIPYRNSLLTQVLSDSLGGNSRTVMVATISAQTRHLEESVSTCQFAQRVAEITNKVKANETMDPDALILRLQDEIKI
uniref:Kinesin-like protein n=1 Tax=Ciona savignyi TaxID=51511 RepID=H2Z634_CIOSA